MPIPVGSSIGQCICVVSCFLIAFSGGAGWKRRQNGDAFFFWQCGRESFMYSDLLLPAALRRAMQRDCEVQVAFSSACCLVEGGSSLGDAKLERLLNATYYGIKLVLSVL
jgi:hypothetical protein